MKHILILAIFIVIMTVSLYSEPLNSSSNISFFIDVRINNVPFAGIATYRIECRFVHKHGVTVFPIPTSPPSNVEAFASFNSGVWNNSILVPRNTNERLYLVMSIGGHIIDEPITRTRVNKIVRNFGLGGPCPKNPCVCFQKW